MAKITEKQLINSLKQLKEIKPRQEWASLLKSQILAEKNTGKTFENPARFATFGNVFSYMFSQRKVAYSLAVILIAVLGAFGIMNMTGLKKSQQQASLIGQTGLKQNVVALNSKINNLAKVAKEGKKTVIPSAISEINANAKNLAQSLKDNPEQDTATLKDIAASLKTLADVPGTDLTANPDVQNLYQTVAQNQIADLQKTTLTDDQKKTLSEAQDLYDQQKYSDALEKLLLIGK